MQGNPQISAHEMAELSASSGGARIQRLSTAHLSVRENDDNRRRHAAHLTWLDETKRSTRSAEEFRAFRIGERNLEQTFLFRFSEVESQATRGNSARKTRATNSLCAAISWSSAARFSIAQRAQAVRDDLRTRQLPGESARARKRMAVRCSAFPFLA